MTSRRVAFLTPEFVTENETGGGLGNYLKEVGYDTGYFGKWHIKSEKSTADNPWHGFDTIDTKGFILSR